MSSVFFVFEYYSVYLYLSNDAKGMKDKKSLFVTLKRRLSSFYSLKVLTLYQMSREKEDGSITKRCLKIRGDN